MKNLYPPVIFVCASVFLSLILFANSAGFAKSSEKKETAEVAPVQKIVLTNVLVDGKKTWNPTHVKAKPGKIEFSLVNTLAEPHGFNIPGVMKSPMVVLPKSTSSVSVDIKKAGQYKLECHMHPAHIASELTIK